MLQQVTVGPPPLPGGVAAVLRFFFNLPQWFQITGFIAGVLLALVALWLLWRRRRAAVSWLLSRPRSMKLGLTAAAGVLVVAFAGTGAAGFHYIDHNNGFCTGCHVMAEPFRRFAGSKHDSLECHACHQQSMVASMRQLYLWVADRPERIGDHAKVPTRVCANCHVRGDAKETWQRIASTAGHRTHLQSDSSALKNVQCVTCHGVEVHRFVPVNATCAQAGCHVTLRITLDKMRDQTELHCVLCHRFTAEVPALATYDSARGTLVPGMKQCVSCHEMQAVLGEFDPAHDPHRGTCGDCHNPHTQARPQEAALTCTSAKCHADWRSEPFHIGANHRAMSKDCTLCHEPHHAKVDPSDCAGCHAAVKARRAGKRLNPPLPFDTTKALRRVSDLSHHQAPQASDCGRCHGASELARPLAVEVRVAVAGAEARLHGARFEHERHRALKCVACHTTPATLDPEPAVASCAACHDDHHARGRPCAACHTADLTPAVQAAHAPPIEAHIACDACHLPAIVARLVPDRALCLTCHTAQQDHHAERECTQCHFGATPEAFQDHLRKAAGS